MLNGIWKNRKFGSESRVNIHFYKTFSILRVSLIYKLVKYVFIVLNIMLKVMLNSSQLTITKKRKVLEGVSGWYKHKTVKSCHLRLTGFCCITKYPHD